MNQLNIIDVGPAENIPNSRRHILFGKFCIIERIYSVFSQEEVKSWEKLFQIENDRLIVIIDNDKYYHRLTLFNNILCEEKICCYGTTLGKRLTTELIIKGYATILIIQRE